jgi:hypothetical protein
MFRLRIGHTLNASVYQFIYAPIQMVFNKDTIDGLRRLHLPPYTEEQFLEVSAKVLPKLKIAHVIGKVVWEQGGTFVM